MCAAVKALSRFDAAKHCDLVSQKTDCRHERRWHQQRMCTADTLTHDPPNSSWSLLCETVSFINKPPRRNNRISSRKRTEIQIFYSSCAHARSIGYESSKNLGHFKNYILVQVEITPWSLKVYSRLMSSPSPHDDAEANCTLLCTESIGRRTIATASSASKRASLSMFF